MAMSDYGTLKFLLDADQETGFAHGATVTTFTDRSGNARNFTAEGTPIMSVGSFRGRRAVYLDGGARFVRSEASLLASGGFTVVMGLRVVTQLASTASFLFDTGADSADSRKAFQHLATGALALSLDGGGGTMTGAAKDIRYGEDVVVSATVKGAGSTVRVNGQQIATGTVSTTLASASPMRIGHRFDATGPSAARQMYVGLLAAYTAPLSLANELAAIQEVMGAGWAQWVRLSGALPAATMA